MASTVLITGVSRHLGGAYARRLSAEESVGRIIGVDVVPPRHGIGRPGQLLAGAGVPDAAGRRMGHP